MVNLKLHARIAASLVLFAVLSSSAIAYTRTGPSWSAETARYDLNSSSNANDAAFIEAMQKWNGFSDFSFTYGTTGSFNPCTGGGGGSPDRKNSWRFSSNNCGKGWGGSTLAVTTTWSSSGKTIDTDIVFNSNRSWGIHDGSNTSANGTDFRRVAVHELGHALGLGHESNNTAIMKPFITNTIINPQPDDIAGMRAIYGGTGSVQRTLSVSVNGSGSVSSSPAGINCPTDCSQPYTQGTSVSLSAQAASGWLFKNWSGACSGSNACVVSMTSAKNVSAVFEAASPQQHTLSVTVNGSGSVSSSPAGINCPTDCSQPYTQGTSVSLSAQAASGWLFKNWSGACSGSNACVVSMSSAKSVSAVFEAAPPQQHTLSVTVSGSGSVSSSPAGINCPVDCQQKYDEGKTVALLPDAAAGWKFVSWSGACSGVGSCEVSMSSNRNVGVLFSKEVKQPPVKSLVPLILLLLGD